METPTIRPANLTEADAVRQLVDAAYAKWIVVIGRKPAPMLSDYPALIERGFVHVIQSGGQLAGVLVTWPLEDALYLDNLAVHPDFQRQGLGQRLLNFAGQLAREQGFSFLCLLTNEKFETNQTYYRKRGYVETRRETTGDGRRIVWMHKPILPE